MVRSVSTRTRSVVYDALVALPQERPSESGEPAWFDLSSAPGTLGREVRDLIGSTEFDAWSEALGRVGNCERPIRLRGQSTTVDATTGEVISTYRSDAGPLGVTHVRCGNRRQDMCASCARLYAADMFHLIRAGITGGKTVPERVAENPLVFLTVTGPSFGLVHSRRDGASRCHPYAAGDPRCPHGRPRTCHARHGEDDHELGQPLCPQCYDYASHVVWQWWAPDLWRRLTIALRRLLARTLGVPADRLGEVATLQYAKVAEYQVRGAVHFHALVRLDGPRTVEGFAAAPAVIDAGLLDADPVARRHDLPEMARFMLATGLRLGETLGVTWADLDLTAGTVAVHRTVVRVKGQGLVAKRVKSRASERGLLLPAWCVELLRARRVRLGGFDGPVFPDTRGRWRDPSNVGKVFRAVRGGSSFEWVKTHTYRKTVATLLDQSGASARMIADQLGHSRVSMTQDVYLGRRAANTGNLAALEAYDPGPATSEAPDTEDE